jgi:uncharacterized protein YlxP (DUF503 family)
MIVGVLTLEIFFPYARSLKDKRQQLKGFTERIRGRFNVSLAEIDFQDKWQRALIGVAAVNSSRSLVETLLNRVLTEAETTLEGEITGHRIEFI